MLNIVAEIKIIQNSATEAERHCRWQQLQSRLRDEDMRRKLRNIELIAGVERLGERAASLRQLTDKLRLIKRQYDVLSQLKAAHPASKPHRGASGEPQLTSQSQHRESAQPQLWNQSQLRVAGEPQLTNQSQHSTDSASRTSQSQHEMSSRNDRTYQPHCTDLHASGHVAQSEVSCGETQLHPPRSRVVSVLGGDPSLLNGDPTSPYYDPRMAVRAWPSCTSNAPGMLLTGINPSLFNEPYINNSSGPWGPYQPGRDDLGRSVFERAALLKSKIVTSLPGKPLSLARRSADDSRRLDERRRETFEDLRAHGQARIREDDIGDVDRRYSDHRGRRESHHSPEQGVERRSDRVPEHGHGYDVRDSHHDYDRSLRSVHRVGDLTTAEDDQRSASPVSRHALPSSAPMQDRSMSEYWPSERRNTNWDGTLQGVASRWGTLERPGDGAVNELNADETGGREERREREDERRQRRESGGRRYSGEREDQIEELERAMRRQKQLLASTAELSASNGGYRQQEYHQDQAASIRRRPSFRHGRGHHADSHDGWEDNRHRHNDLRNREHEEIARESQYLGDHRRDDEYERRGVEYRERERKYDEHDGELSYKGERYDYDKRGEYMERRDSDIRRDKQNQHDGRDELYSTEAGRYGNRGEGGGCDATEQLEENGYHPSRKQSVRYRPNQEYEGNDQQLKPSGKQDSQNFQALPGSDNIGKTNRDQNSQNNRLTEKTSLHSLSRSEARGVNASVSETGGDAEGEGGGRSDQTERNGRLKQQAESRQTDGGEREERTEPLRQERIDSLKKSDKTSTSGDTAAVERRQRRSSWLLSADDEADAASLPTRANVTASVASAEPSHRTSRGDGVKGGRGGGDDRRVKGGKKAEKVKKSSPVKERDPVGNAGFRKDVTPAKKSSKPKPLTLAEQVAQKRRKNDWLGVRELSPTPPAASRKDGSTNDLRGIGTPEPQLKVAQQTGPRPRAVSTSSSDESSRRPPPPPAAQSPPQSPPQVLPQSPPQTKPAKLRLDSGSESYHLSADLGGDDTDDDFWG